MEALGPLLILLSIPLMLRWVPPNGLYGFRIPATCRNRSVWYDVNALWARHIFLLGLLMVALEFVVPRAHLVFTLRAVGLIGLAGTIVADWRTANRWERERTQIR